MERVHLALGKMSTFCLRMATKRRGQQKAWIAPTIEVTAAHWLVYEGHFVSEILVSHLHLIANLSAVLLS